MDAHSDYSAVYTGPALRAWLTCNLGGCHLELQTLADEGRRPYHRAVVEVLLQPRGSDGLAQGGPIAVCRQTVTLHAYSGGQTSWGYCQLPPGFTANLAARCYLRIEPEGDEPTTNTTIETASTNRNRPPPA